MITAILVISTLLTQPSGDFSKTNEAITVSVEASAPVLGIIKPKYNKRRIQRKNTVNKINHRSKRIQRKNGIGLVKWEEVNHV